MRQLFRATDPESDVINRTIRRALESPEVDYRALESATGLTQTALHQRISRIRAKDRGQPRTPAPHRRGAAAHATAPHKLTWELVDRIRSFRASGMSCAKIAAAIGVSTTTIRGVVSGRSWKEEWRP